MRGSVYFTASFSVFSRRRAKLPIIYPDIRLDYKLATLPIVLSDVRVQRAIEAIVRAARTKKIGDGKVFVIAIDQVIEFAPKNEEKRRFKALLTARSFSYP